MKSATYLVIILLSFFSVGQEDKFIDCKDIKEGFTGECKSYFENGKLGTHLIVEDGSIVVAYKYFMDGSKYLTYDKSELENFSFTKELLHSNRKNHHTIHIEKGNGSVRSNRKNGSLLMSGEVRDKKLVFPWLIFNDRGEPIDTIKPLAYNHVITDSKAFATMINEAFVYAKIHYENYQFREKDPEKQLLPPIPMEVEEEEDEQIVIEVPPIDIPDQEDEKDPDPIVDYPDKDASFPGGLDAMKAFLAENIKYPETALENGVQGRVYIQFVVYKDGSFDTIKILRGVSKEIDEEAKRVIGLMPDWIPAEVKGEPVNAWVRIPLSFKL